MSRLENSAKNILGSFGNNFVASLLGLISRTVFIYTLGAPSYPFRSRTAVLRVSTGGK